jgi:hypothetical protein
MLDRIRSLLSGAQALLPSWGQGPALVLALAGLGGCAHTAGNPTLLSSGTVDPQELSTTLHCPRGTTITQGQTRGVVSAIWCERTGGVKHGPFIEWYENHQKKSAGEYLESRRQGPWVFWLPGGQQDSTITYENGTVVSQSAAPPASAPTQAPTQAPAPAQAQAQAQPPAAPVAGSK